MGGDCHFICEEDVIGTAGDRVIAEVIGQEIAVFNVEGEYHAVANYCPHQAGPLCEGKLRGQMTVDDDGWGWQYEDIERNVTCPWHAWKFDVTTGRNVNDDRYAVPTYDVEVKGGDVFVVR
jgi:nitrite reductase/ring-hydroxylating ferredoxin subunit